MRSEEAIIAEMSSLEEIIRNAQNSIDQAETMMQANREELLKLRGKLLNDKGEKSTVTEMKSDEKGIQ